jgi:arginyl-tRNA synthetase
MNRYYESFVNVVAQATGLEADAVREAVRVPEPKLGDFSFPCFVLAKQLKKNPAQIAKDMAAKIKKPGLFTDICAAGPYVNATIDSQHLVSTLIPEVRTLGMSFCQSSEGAGQTVVIDYSSPNIAKPLGFHHLRSTMIGNALSRIHQALGFEVRGINFLGDWGKTFGLLAEAFVRFGDRDELATGGIAYLLKLYIKANQAAEEDAGFDEAARAMFRKQEDGDAEAVELWQLFRTISINEFERIYQRLGVAFFAFEGESHYREGLDEVVSAVEHRPGTRIDQGALVVDMEYAEDETPMMLRKTDGATLYATRDIAAAIDRWNRFKFAKSLYVVGVEQSRHFEQLFRALGEMGHAWTDKMQHVRFGRIQGMSTRKGRVVFLEDVLDEARDRAREKMQAAEDDREIDIEKVAEEVGIGGVIFGDLKNLRTSDYTFDWEEVLNPKGFTGVCCQYAHARCCSVLRKGGGVPQTADLTLLKAPEEITLAKEIARLPGAIQSAAEALEPSRLARAIYEVARAWNRYQQAGVADRDLRILCEDEVTKAARLTLVDAVRIALKTNLSLLGVNAPEAM